MSDNEGVQWQVDATCKKCEYYETQFFCGHRGLNVAPDAHRETEERCLHFRIDALNRGYCLKTPFPTVDNVKMHPMWSMTHDIELCGDIECFQETQETTRAAFESFRQQYDSLGKEIFQAPGLRELVKMLPNEHKQTLKDLLFGTKLRKKNKMPGPPICRTFDLMDELLDTSEVKMSEFEDLRFEREDDLVIIHFLVRPRLTDPEDVILALKKKEISALVRTMMETNLSVADSLLKLYEAILALKDLRDALESNGVVYYENFEESAGRWAAAKTWAVCMLLPNLPTDTHPALIEFKVQTEFGQWDDSTFTDGSELNDRPVGAAAFYLAACSPQQTPEEGDDGAVYDQSLGYWDAIGTFDSLYC